MALIGAIYRKDSSMLAIRRFVNQRVLVDDFIVIEPELVTYSRVVLLVRVGAVTYRRSLGFRDEIVVNGNVIVKALELRPGSVCLGFGAPAEIKIDREEIRLLKNKQAKQCQS